MQRRPRLVVVGACGVDRSFRASTPLVMGCSNPARGIETLGGAALNVASNLAAFGENAHVISSVGDDDAGRHIAAELRRRGVTPHLRVDSELATASYTALLNPDGDLAIAVNDMAICEAFQASVAEPRIASLKADDTLIIDANLHSGAIEALVGQCERLQERPRLVALSVSAAKAPRLLPVLSRIDMLFCNRSEASALTHAPKDASMNAHLSALSADGIAQAVVTSGADAVGIVRHGVSDELNIARTAQITDVTGAGDALVAATLSTLTGGADLKTAVRQGVLAAQAVLQVEGPWRSDLAQAIGMTKMRASEVAP
ncbi:MAG: PfkB family carbohydrate kinase [Ahrensia sp.]|nr:PfkB family carbohydrate kinase [Ahrensia sp.]